MPRALLLLLILGPSLLAAQSADDGRRCDRISKGEADPATTALVERVAAEQPDGALAHFYRGCQAFGRGEGGGKAAPHFERAVRRADASAAAHDWLARAYGDQAGRSNPITQARLAPKIRSHFERAVALDPANVDARAYLVQFYLQAPGFMGGSETKAWEQIAELRRLSPYRGGMLAAQVRVARKDVANALLEYEAVAVQHPDSTAPASGVASVASQLGQYDRAFVAVDRLLARQPDDRAMLYALGRLAALSGRRLDDGAAALERYVAAGATRPGEPSIAHAHWRLGGIHEHRGDRARARQAYETALRIDPELAEARKALAALR